VSWWQNKGVKNKGVRTLSNKEQKGVRTLFRQAAAAFAESFLSTQAPSYPFLFRQQLHNATPTSS
jgi:hypothetical protein